MPERSPFEPAPGEVLPQPHEGIRGVDRSGSYLLSLDDQAVAHRDALIHMAYLLHTACIGGDAPVVERLKARMRDPQIGDLVVEEHVALRSGVRRPADLDTRIKGFGYLVARRREWGCTDEQWEAYKREEAEGPFPYELGDAERRVEPSAWYIQYGPNAVDICRWENCDFFTLPIGEDFRSPAGTRNPDGSVTLTRDDLVGSLADMGIQLKGTGG